MNIPRMSLPRSAPRQVYRVYTEEEFLAAEDWSMEAEPDFAPIPDGEPRPRGRVAAVAALTAVVAAVVGVVAISGARFSAGIDPRFASRRIAPTPPREDRWTRSLPADRGSSGVGMRRRRRIRQASTAIRRAAERHALRAAAPPPLVAHTYVSSQSHPAATVATSAPASAGPAIATAASPPTAAPATTASVTAATATAAAHGAGSEFGFER
jgi:hypothetical protein